MTGNDDEVTQAGMATYLQNNKPTQEFLHHISATLPANIGFTVMLLDGTTYAAAGADHMFLDGLSIVHAGHRIYIPKTAIRGIVINNPGDK